MASSTLKTTKDGKRYYYIQVSRGRGKAPYTTQWYVPDGWSKTAIERGLRKAISDFENDCREGKILSRQEKKDLEKQRQEEENRIETVKQYGERVFMPTKKIQCAENTRAYYQNILDKHIYPHLGVIKLPDLKPAQISAYFLKMQEAKELSHQTQIGIYVTLNQLLKMAYLSDLIMANPMDKVKRPRQPKSELKDQPIKAYTEEELKRIRERIKTEPVKWQAFINFMMDTGCRSGEVCGLKWEKIDFDNCSAVIDNNCCYTKQKGVYEDTPKGGKARTVYFSVNTAALLKEHQKRQKTETKNREKRLEKDHKPLDITKIALPRYVFTEKGYSTPMHPQTPTRYFKKLEKLYGIEDFHPHKLRHSFASVAITRGADVASVSEVLGHADKGTTLKMYTHASEESKRRAAQIFQAALSEGGSR